MKIVGINPLKRRAALAYPYMSVSNQAKEPPPLLGRVS